MAKFLSFKRRSPALGLTFQKLPNPGISTLHYTFIKWTCQLWKKTIRKMSTEENLNVFDKITYPWSSRT